MNDKKRIVSLFDYSGNWSKPYKEAGYEVIQVDLKLGIDVYDLCSNSYTKIYGVLAAPPCTHFSSSGARWFKEKDKDGRTEEAVKLVEHTLKLITSWNPTFWALENPVGRIASLIPSLGRWSFIFDPCDFGDPYTKKTCLWGKFNHPQKTPVEPTEGSKLWKNYGGKSEKTKEARSITPMGFARAFFEANK